MCIRDPPICWVFSGHRLCASWADTPGWVTQAASLQKSAKGEGETQGLAGKQSRSASLPAQHDVSLYIWSVSTSGAVFITSGCMIAIFCNLKFALSKWGTDRCFIPGSFLGALCSQTQLLCLLVSIPSYFRTSRGVACCCFSDALEQSAVIQCLLKCVQHEDFPLIDCLWLIQTIALGCLTNYYQKASHYCSLVSQCLPC